MFDVDFDRTQRPIPEGWTGCTWAAIRIGRFRESILIETHYWNRLQYYTQWQAACSRLLSGESPGVFLVGVVGPWRRTRFLFSWVVYIDHGRLYVRNIMLFPRRFPHARFRTAHLAVPKRTTHSGNRGTKNMRISEWRTTLKSVAVLAKRLQRRIDRLSRTARVKRGVNQVRSAGSPHIRRSKRPRPEQWSEPRGDG